MARLVIEADDGRTAEVVDDLERYDLGYLPAAASILSLISQAAKGLGIEFERASGG